MIAAALLQLALASAPGCRAALAEATRVTDPRALAATAVGIVIRLERGGAGGPVIALDRAARALGEAAEAEEADLGPPARAFRAALARHCELAALPALGFASGGDRAALEEILARPEFRRARSDPLALRRLLLAGWGWLLERLGSVEAARYAGLGRTLFLAAAALAAALGVFVWLDRRGARRRGKGALPPARSAPTAPDRSLALAEEALAGGDSTGAVRFALLAALAALERSGRVPRGRALTNLELVRALASGGLRAAVLAGELGTLSRRFDAAIYGGRPVTASEAGEALAGARRIRAGADEAAA